MIKLKIIEKLEYSYIFCDIQNQKYDIPFYTYGDIILNVGDILYVPDYFVKEKNIYTYGPIAGNYCKMNNDINELIKVVSREKEFYLQRYYG